MSNEITVQQAVETLVAALQKNDDYTWGWHCNIAMSAVDAGCDPYTANQGAANFLQNLAKVDTRKSEFWNHDRPVEEVSQHAVPVHYTQATASEVTIDFSDLMEVVDELNGYPHRDILGSHGHFAQWCDAMGIPKDAIDENGDHRRGSRIWFAQYRASPTGEAACPEYRDFWHWFIDDIGEFERGEANAYYIDSAIEELEEQMDEDDRAAWVLPILKRMHEVVQGHPAYDEEGCLMLHIDW